MKKELILLDFICVGPGKTGTNTLHHCLKEHPAISLAKHVKGARFFDRFYDRGIKWYAELFEHCPAGTIKGEISETYFYNELVPQRIHQHLPDVKIIIIFRNPIERAFKVFLQLCKLGLMRGTFDECLKLHDNLIHDNLYHQHLERFLEYFPEQNILVKLFDDLQADQDAFISDIYNFLGVDSSFKPDSLCVKSNPTTLPRLQIINRLAFRTMWLVRRLDWLPVLAWAKQSSLVRDLLFKAPDENNQPTMSPEARKYLQDTFKDEIEKISVYLGRNLDHWK